MALNYISSVLKLSLQTFKESPRSELFSENLYTLKGVLDKLTSEHVSFDINSIKNKTASEDVQAPSTYIHLYKDQYINICIFVLRSKMKMPLHSHPEMHGLLKVIYGKVRIKSFSLDTNPVSEFPHDNNELVADKVIFAEKMEDVIADSKSETCMLDPRFHNLHEIETIDGPAAFLDVLAPPYNTIILGNGQRICRYYKAIKHISGNVYQLSEIPPPSYFWCDVAPYMGPKLFNKSINELFQS